MVVSFYIDPAYTSSNTGIFEIRLRGADTANRVRLVLANIKTYAEELPQRQGWYCLKLPLRPIKLATDSYPNGDGGAGGEIALAACKSIQIVNNYPSGQTPSVTIDKLEFVPQQAHTYYIPSFDGGYAFDYKIAQYLASKGISGTFFVQTSLIDTGSYLTTAQLTEMQNMGHLIANHSSTHISVAADTTPVAAIADMVAGTTWLEAHGFTRGSRIFGTPGGSSPAWNWPYNYALVGNYCDFIRLTGRQHALADIERHPRVGRFSGTSNFDFDNSDAEGKFVTVLTQRLVQNNVLIQEGWHAYNKCVEDGEVNTKFKNEIDLVLSMKQYGLVPINYADLVYGDVNRSRGRLLR
jgi:hypothetical protein